MTCERRTFITAAGAAGLLAGCGGSLLSDAPGFPQSRWDWRTSERDLLAPGRLALPLVTRGGANAAVLRTYARPVPPGLCLERVRHMMAAAMVEAGGVGLAGPQVGLSLRVAVLVLDYRTEKPRTVFVRNPVIVERSDETEEGYEGCLSIPGVGGLVRRSRWIRVRHTSAGGDVLDDEAEGPNAVLWQHELDHLDGVLYVDRLLGDLLPMEEVRRRRKLLEEERAKDGSLAPPAAEWVAEDPDPLYL